MKSATSARRRGERPSQGQLVLPLLEALHDLGGSARARDVAEALADRFDLPAEDRQETVRYCDGQATRTWDRHVRFAKLKAQQLGYIASEGKGRWSLGDEGKDGLARTVPALVLAVYTDAAGQPVHAQIELAGLLPTIHTLHCGDSRDVSWIGSGGCHLVLCSPPYFDLKRYGTAVGQLGDIDDFDEFLSELDKVWKEAFRILAPGGRFACVVGDVLRSRKLHGQHYVLPLTDEIRVRAFRLGFQCLNGPTWHKRGNIAYEQGGNGILGTPGMPRGVIPLESERVLLFKKPGEYRRTTPSLRNAARMAKDEAAGAYRSIWSDIPGAKTTKGHPAPYPVALARRIILSQSMPNDTVADLFGGSMSTTLAAMQSGRNSVSVEVCSQHFQLGLERVQMEARHLAG